ncbi:MAG TPA: SPW repeat protein [Humisphaera sp.]
MNVIPTRLHGMLDYSVGTLFVLLPWLLRFHDNLPATAVFVVLGLGAIGYSLVTRYELGLIPLVPMNVHLSIDLVSGLFLMASPWLLGFAHRVYWPHILFGAVEVIVVALTRWQIAPAPVPVRIRSH